MVAYLGQGFTCILAVPTVRPTPKGESAGEAFFIGSMKYYLHHIGDFDRATRHLSRIERSVYSDLIDLYYDTEQQLPLDVSLICRKILARTNEESTAVEQTLNEFFTKTPTGWYHERCETVIDEYKANTSQKALAGRASAAKKALKRQQALNGDSTGVERTYNGTSTNQEPKTINLKPSSVSKDTAGKPAKITEPDEIIFGYGLPMLTTAGTPEKQARSFLGGLRKHHGDDALISKLRDCAKAKPLQPLEWLAAALPPRGTLNAQEKLEAGNSAVLKRFMEKDNARL